MGEILDKVKGKAKQVEGIITGDKARQHEGEVDEAKGNLKGVLNKADDAVQGAVTAVKQAVKKI
ncbi:MAG: CsbD family protein [Myxococcales bacterium]|nr:CsbD family protein [Myxococcales bacterium]